MRSLQTAGLLLVKPDTELNKEFFLIEVLIELVFGDSSELKTELTQFI